MAANRRVYIPQPMNITLPASQENPGGRVVQLQTGYADLDETLAAHPVLARLQSIDPGEQDRLDRCRKAQEEYNEAVAEAGTKLNETLAEVDKERREYIEKASEDYAKRKEEAQAKGESFVEVHPDLETQRAMALTASPGQFATTPPGAFALTPTADDHDRARTVRASLPSEADNTKTMQGAQGPVSTSAPSGRRVVRE